ncbi:MULTISPECIES: hypothetical protein [unclassified Rhodococcus (in: high G+C Gram-positive bacteria)]|uniref:hypothetical protein n=1 Tax=unclassified Rhodococcus (in: high G+C Gram-positive bacteria) TaxID=192944 RepID=UPI000B9A1A43|nr:MULTISPECIES: hypothetical protein [unclassified Rhodococcus (in: high G+C Gram-positive bacteria)]OZE32793.1 hypothetical protein CH259_20225 [Rhodococcus sp. 05-2254-4]OZE44312.1 hypothetical protein CH261_18430 [Rhodococcus sp. 05-2254-3]OZE56005.1 hypothetical protein CH283_00490 [Rhodococcus sp. 05-2254-2]
MLQFSRTVPPHRVPPTVAITGAAVWNRREAYWFLVAVIVPAACWSRFPTMVPYVFAIVLLGAVVFRSRRIAWWASMLRWGLIADVETVDTAPRGDRNLRLAHATGWNVQRRWYTGVVTESTVRYRAGEARGHLFVRGLPFTTGVVLAHSKNPGSAMAISDFPCDLQLDGRGRWAASFPPGFWRQALATSALYGYAMAGLMLSLGVR